MNTPFDLNNTRFLESLTDADIRQVERVKRLYADWLELEEAQEQVLRILAEPKNRAVFARLERK